MCSALDSSARCCRATCDVHWPNRRHPSTTISSCFCHCANSHLPASFLCANVSACSRARRCTLAIQFFHPVVAMTSIIFLVPLVGGATAGLRVRLRTRTAAVLDGESPSPPPLRPSSPLRPAPRPVSVVKLLAAPRCPPPLPPAGLPPPGASSLSTTIDDRHMLQADCDASRTGYHQTGSQRHRRISRHDGRYVVGMQRRSRGRTQARPRS